MTTLNETHDPALRSWVDSANAAATEFPIQNLPLAVFRRRGTNEVFRGGVAIGEQIVDLAAAVACGVFDGNAVPAGEGRGRRFAQRADGTRPSSLVGAALGAVARLARRLARTRAVGALPCRTGRCRIHAAGAHRRLHRLLHGHPPRDDGGQAVPPRQPAAAELQVGADRLPRSRLVHRRQRHADPAAVGPDQGHGREAALRPQPEARLRARARLPDRHAATRSASRSPSKRPNSTCSAWRCSTTGPRATSSPGNTSRSGPSCRRTSAARCRLGW